MGWDETKTDRTFPSLGLTDAGKLDLPNLDDDTRSGRAFRRALRITPWYTTRPV
jgi:hypothetical protein